MKKRKLIPKELQSLISWAVNILGEAIKREFGSESFLRIESVRKKMKGLRAVEPQRVYQALSKDIFLFKNQFFEYKTDK